VVHKFYIGLLWSQQLKQRRLRHHTNNACEEKQQAYERSAYHTASLIAFKN
jgi:hypothetical protein